MAELRLPNPGKGRYWEISDGGDGDVQVILKAPDGGHILSEYVYSPTQYRIEEQASRLIDQAAALDFIGVYKFDEEK